MGRTPVYYGLCRARHRRHGSCFIGPCGMADPDRPPIAPRRRPRLSTSVALRPYPPLVVPGPHPRPDSSARPRASRRNAPGSEVAASRATRRARAPDLGASSSTRVTRYRAAPGLDATTTARVRRVRRTGAPGERDGGALPSLSIYLYTLSRSRRSNMQPARDHLNSITVVCASPRRAAPLRLHRPHVARVYRTTGDHRTHYLIQSRSEPKRPPRG